MAQSHVEPPLIPLIKRIYDGKSEKYFAKIELRRYPTSSTLGLYEFRISLFDNGYPEEFLLFVRNFNMTLVVTGTLEIGVNIQYLHMLVRGEALHHFYLLSSYVESTETLNLEYIVKGLALYFSLLNLLSKKSVQFVVE